MMPFNLKLKKSLALLICLSLAYLPFDTIRAQETVLFFDDFTGSTLNSVLWHLGSNSYGGHYTISDSVLVLASGTTNGGGTWVATNQAFPVGEQTLIFEARAVTSSLDGGWLGFHSAACGNTVAFSIAYRETSSGIQNGLAAQVSTIGNIRIVDLSFIDPTVWHTYRIEHGGNIAHFYVDGELVATHTEGLLDCPMNIRLDRPSRGVNQTLSVDWASLRAIPPNTPPACSGAYPSVDFLWPPEHQMDSVNVLGVTDPEGDPITITITSIFQDEPTNGLGDGDISPDGQGIGTTTAIIRAERSGVDNGRIYHIAFTADDGHGGSCSSEVLVGVRHDQGRKGEAVDDGPLYDSTLP